MNISKKQKTAIIFSLPILLGVYLIYKQFSKKSNSSNTPIGPAPKQASTPNKPTQTNGNDSLPLKKGSRDAGAPLSPNGRVVDLQKLINVKGYVPSGTNTYVKLVEDGIFGAKTQEALNFWIQQNTIDTQADWNYLYNQIYPTPVTYTNDANSSSNADIYFQQPQG